jgi:hypothetical protein
MRRTSIAITLTLGLLVPAPAGAQEIQIETETKPEVRVPRPEIVTPPGAREITRPRESDFYPQDIRVRLDPAFIEPFTAVRQTGPTSAVRFGLSGWTAPNTPVSQSEGTIRELQGWLALGFSVVWDVPVDKAARSPGVPAR